MILLAMGTLFAAEFIGQTEKPYVRTMTITPANINTLPDQIESNCFYKLDLYEGSADYSVCRIDIWNEKGIIEKMETIMLNEQNHFVKKIYLSSKSTKLAFSLIDSKNSSSKVIKVFDLTPLVYEQTQQTPLFSKDAKTGLTKVSVDYTNLDSVEDSIETGKAYLFDVYLDEADYTECYFQNTYDREQQLYVSHFVRQPNGHFTNTFIVPSSLKLLSIVLENTNSQEKILALNLKSMAVPRKKSEIISPKHYATVQGYRTKEADKRVVAYLELIEARNLSRQDPDKVIELCVNRINELTSDGFEKVMLIHDAVWYLVDYDLDNFDAAYLTDAQDYYSVLKRGCGIGEGLVKLFSQMCYAAGIPCCDVYGESVFPNDYFRQKVGLHAWNIVKIGNYWYTTDINWDISHVSKGTRDNYYTSMWMFVEPKTFVQTHFPEFKEYQLLEKPYVRNDLLK